MATKKSSVVPVGMSVQQYAVRDGHLKEGVIGTFRAIALNRKIVRIDTVPVPTRKDKDGKLIYTERSTVDGVGIMLDGSGRAVCEEVKSMGNPPLYKSRLKKHQQAHLDLYLQYGGIAVLTVVDRLHQVFVVPWQIAREHSSLGYDELRPFQVMPQSYFVRFVRKS